MPSEFIDWLLEENDMAIRKPRQRLGKTHLLTAWCERYLPETRQTLDPIYVTCERCKKSKAFRRLILCADPDVRAQAFVVLDGIAEHGTIERAPAVFRDTVSALATLGVDYREAAHVARDVLNRERLVRAVRGTIEAVAKWEREAKNVGAHANLGTSPAGKKLNSQSLRIWIASFSLTVNGYAMIEPAATRMRQGWLNAAMAAIAAPTEEEIFGDERKALLALDGRLARFAVETQVGVARGDAGAQLALGLK